MRVLLFVQTGDARPKCAYRHNDVAEPTVKWWCEDTSWAERVDADRWWLVECANAEAGRFVIANAAIGGLEHWPGKGRILAHGGKR